MPHLQTVLGRVTCATARDGEFVHGVMMAAHTLGDDLARYSIFLLDQQTGACEEVRRFDKKYASRHEPAIVDPDGTASQRLDMARMGMNAKIIRRSTRRRASFHLGSRSTLAKR
jgi:hypothetical protein